MSFPQFRFPGQKPIAAVLLAVIGLGLAAPALADISRSCTGTIWIGAEGGTRVTREFTMPVTVANRLHANQARRRSRDAIISCVEAHWNMRMSDMRPHWCNAGDNYPFQGFSEDMTEMICDANPGRQSFLVDITLWVHGGDGCESERMVNDWGYYDIANDYRVYCWTAPEPERRNGWNLPGRDYRWFEMDRGANWQECAKTCRQEARCEAWTYKHATGGNPPLCFLKDSVPSWHRDNRFISGIKGDVLH